MLTCGVRIELLLLVVLDKKEVERVIKEFCAMVEIQFQNQVRVVRNDNGIEFLCLKSYFAAQGIMHQTSCVRTPQQNGRVERKHCHILNVARELRFQASPPIRFWGECVLMASYLINKTSSLVLGGKTPYEKFYGKAPSYENLRTFGCLRFAHRVDLTKDNFGARSRECVFLGYPHGKKGWRVLDKQSGEIFVSCDVVFSELVFPYLAHSVQERSQVAEFNTIEYMDDEVYEVRGSSIPAEVVEEHDGVVAAVPVSGGESGNEEVVSGEAANENLGRGHRLHRPLVLLNDFVTYNARCVPDLVPTKPVSRNGSSGTSLYPISHYITCDMFSARHRAFVGNLDAAVEPRSFYEAMKD